MAKSNIPGILSPDRSEVKTTLTDKTTPMSGRLTVTTASITTSNPDEKKSRPSPQPSETFSEARLSHDFRQVGYVYKVAIYQHATMPSLTWAWEFQNDALWDTELMGEAQHIEHIATIPTFISSSFLERVHNGRVFCTHKFSGIFQMPYNPRVQNDG